MAVAVTDRLRSLWPVPLAALAMVVLTATGAVEPALDRLGLSPWSAAAWLVACLAGSLIELPLGRVRSHWQPPDPRRWLAGDRRMPYLPLSARTRIAVNLGGGLLPVTFALQLWVGDWARAGDSLLVLAAVAALSYAIGQARGRAALAATALLPALCALLVATAIDGPQAPAAACLGGTLGVLLGAGLLRLPEARRSGAPVVSVGGPGTLEPVLFVALAAPLAG